VSTDFSFAAETITQQDNLSEGPEGWMTLWLQELEEPFQDDRLDPTAADLGRAAPQASAGGKTARKV